MKTAFFVGLALLLLTVLTGCSEPPVPPEVQLALSQEEDLWRAGANLYAPEHYSAFMVQLKASREQFSVERSRLSWFRNYESVTEKFRAVLAQGEVVRRALAQKQAQQAAELLKRTAHITERLQALRDLTLAIKDSRITASSLSRVEILLAEAQRFSATDQPVLALSRLDEADTHIAEMVSKIRPILAKYIDKTQLSHWKQLVDEVVAESRRRAGYAIVVNKLRRQLTLYHKGVAIETYPVGLGFNPLGDKLYSGDRATPEGRYQVTGKLPNSKFYRALLLNYPNADDQRRFAEAKRKKRIPANAKIGGLIEIHGGGKDGATLGCIGLNNSQMLELFNRIEVGTPVVIVAAMGNDNLVRLALGRLE